MIKIKKRRLISLLIVAALLISFAALSPSMKKSSADTVEIPTKHVMINLGKDETSYNITWTEEGELPSTLIYAPSSEMSGSEFPASAVKVNASKEQYYNNDGIYTCRAKMSGLTPDTEYTYLVGSASAGWQGPYTVKTGRKGDGAFSFILVGDPQLGTDSTPESQSRFWNTSLENIRNWAGRDIEFMLSAGDHINYYDKHTEFDWYSYPSWLRSLPQINTPGNHDDGYSCFSNNFTFDDVDPVTCSDAGRFSGDYWAEYDGALFISLNINTTSYAAHKAFIENAIDEFRARYGEPTWKIVFYHESSYSAAADRHNSSKRSVLVPILSELDIDVVLMGHEHVYSRTYMMSGLDPITDPDRYNEVYGDKYGSYKDPEDGEIIFITSNSSSGSKFYEMYNGEIPYTACKNQENIPNVTKICVTEDCITFRTYRTGGSSSPSGNVDFFALHHTIPGADKYAPSLEVPRETVFSSLDEIDPAEGIYAYDNRDGDISDRIKIEGRADYCNEFTIKYSVTDNAGNTATAERVYKPVAAEEVVNKDTVWQYLDDGTYPYDTMTGVTTDWAKKDFDASSWKEGLSSFGFTDDPDGIHNGRKERTVIEQYGSDESEYSGTTIANYFFRTEFDLSDPESVNYINLKLYYDDGIGIYINGVLFRSENTAEAYRPETYGYCGNTSTLDSTFTNIVIDDPDVIKSLGLKKTGNVLGVELYQAMESSEDIYFEAESVKIGRYLTGLPFTDVKNDAWYYYDVSRAYSAKLMVGMSDSIFSPNSNFTRAMSWAVLSRISGAKTDDEGHEWYYGERKWAMENGVSDGTFPNKPATREQIVTMLYNLSGKPSASGSLDSFADKSSASSWANDALIWAVENKIIFGRGNNILAPSATATRAEVCALVLRYLDLNK